MAKRTKTGASRPAPTAATWPDPDERMLAGARGTPAIMADGREWLLADGGLDNCLDPIRDRIFEEIQVRRRVLDGDVWFAAVQMLAANYGLDEAEGVSLVMLRGEAHKALARAVVEAMFGTGEGRRGYTAWARTALLANGIDPSSLPSSDRGNVLEMLVATGRAVPADEFCEAVAQAGALEGLRARARQSG